MTTTQLQHLLGYLGYAPGAPDGILGSKTKAALLRFQKDQSLTPDGIPGPATEQALKEAVSRDSFRNTPDFWAQLRYFRRSDPYIGCSCGKCGGFPVEPSEKLMRLAEAVRQSAGVPMIPTSTVRCPAHNAAVGGVANSRHLSGNAMDFYLSGRTSAQALSLVRQQPDVAYAYAIDSRCVHMDVR